MLALSSARVTSWAALAPCCTWHVHWARKRGPGVVCNERSVMDCTALCVGVLGSCDVRSQGWQLSRHSFAAA
jgi:hypothetical protein